LKNRLFQSTKRNALTAEHRPSQKRGRDERKAFSNNTDDIRYLRSCNVYSVRRLAEDRILACCSISDFLCDMVMVWA